MTARRQGGERRKELARAERICLRLQTDAMLNKRAAQKAKEPSDIHGWWIVVKSLNEAVQALRLMRGAPGMLPSRPASPPKVERDLGGVPAKNT
jgi:hypothetical protein